MPRQNVYVAAQFRSSEELLKTYWSDAFLQLVHILGPENVYVSVLVSHGLDNAEDAIDQLNAQLAKFGVSRTIVIDPSTHDDNISTPAYDPLDRLLRGWIDTDPSDSDERKLRRVPYLSGLRNRVLQPLQTLRNSGQVFDRMLYLNDVVFEAQDVLTLLGTNGGEFDVACGLDYHYAPYLYDTFAIRDLSFRGPITAVFPYFRDKATRKALLAGQPTRVASCWNGIVVADAALYYDRIVPGHPDKFATRSAFAWSIRRSSHV